MSQAPSKCLSERIYWIISRMPEHTYNPIMAMGFLAMTTLRGKHCRHPIAVMGVVDTLEQSLTGFQKLYIYIHIYI